MRYVRKDVFSMNSKIEDFVNAMKLGELLHKKDEAKESRNPFLCVLAIVGAVATIAAIAYAVYRYFTPDYLEDFEDDFEDDYEDDYEDEIIEPEKACCCSATEEEEKKETSEDEQ